jgi:lipopolysaccharide O-acetyltransferase
MPTYHPSMSARRLLGRAVLHAYLEGRAARSKLFCLVAAGGFHQLGRRTVLELPIRIVGGHRMQIGDDVYVGAGSCLQTVGDAAGPLLFIGAGTSIAGSAVISAASCVGLGERVLLARNVYIADHMHAYGDISTPVLDQGISRVAPVRIGDGAWLGQNVVIGPGVSIGRGAVIGANSVVLNDVPAYAVAVGAPARVVSKFGVGTDDPASLEIAR